MIKLNDLARKTAFFRKKAPEGRYLNLKEIICLGGAGLGVSFICNLINMYVTIGQMPLIYDMGDFGTLHATIIYLVACVGGLVLTPVLRHLRQRDKSRRSRRSRTSGSYNKTHTAGHLRRVERRLYAALQGRRISCDNRHIHGNS